MTSKDVIKGVRTKQILTFDARPREIQGDLSQHRISNTQF
jgi:hypothetical protein